MHKIRSRAARTLLPPKEQMLAAAIAEGIGTEIRLAALDTARARLQFVMDSTNTSANDAALAHADVSAAEAALAQRTYAEDVQA